MADSDLNLLESGKFADATVQCGDKTWPVHRAIICSRSKWFEKALDGSFKEAETGTVVLHDITPDRVDWLLRCLYTGDIEGLETWGDNPFEACCEAYEIVDYFLVLKLGDPILRRLLADLSPAISMFQTCRNMEDFEIAEQNFDMFIDLSIERFYANFFQGVNRAYSNESPSLDPLHQTLVEFLRRSNYMPLGHEFFRAKLKNYPHFARDRVLAIGERLETLPSACLAHPWRKTAVCQKCHRHIQALGESCHSAAFNWQISSKLWEHVCSDCLDWPRT